MKYQIFAVRDRATEAFGNPMFFISPGQAIRSFSDEVNRADEQSTVYKHPGDFDLYSLGEFDTDTGEFVTQRPERIAEGRNLRVQNGDGGK